MTHRLAAAAAASIAALSLAGAVLAHASLVSSDPPANGTLTTTPYRLAAVFDEELTADGSSIVIENQSGAQVARGTVGAEPHTMTADLPELPAGAYTVRWIAMTADDQAVERGTYNFNVGIAPGSGSPSPTQPAGGAASSGTDLVIAIVLAAILISVVVAFVFIRGRR